MEKSRSQVHSEDTKQIGSLKKALEAHCQQNEDRDKIVDERDAITADKLERLMPLVDLIPTLNDIVDNQKATVYMGRKVLRIIGYISAAVGLLYLIFKFWEEIR